MYMLEYL